MIKLSPSILAADPLQMGKALSLVKEAHADELHFDVMDAHFVPNLSFGPSLLAAMKKQDADVVYDVHLMLSDPIRYVEVFAEAGASIITIHQEANDFLPCLEKIRSLGLQTGASLKPATPAETLRSVLPMLDRVLLMTVEPGFGGQKLMPEVLNKARELRLMGFDGDIEADGGIGLGNMQQLADSGINVLVMGTSFFKAEDPQAVAAAVHAL
ncbi:MAG: ribulose-phosphate 3-epimerase [Clostridiales bacterium]|nr:ribulose-phosphate 3-epimerase [Clostridiales bacterium]